VNVLELDQVEEEMATSACESGRGVSAGGFLALECSEWLICRGTKAGLKDASPGEVPTDSLKRMAFLKGLLLFQTRLN
jgi:hypothetical protein